MKIDTATFGEIEIEEEKVISFEEKILGFEDYTEFTVIDSLDDDVFYWLQSIEEPELSFIMIAPGQLLDDYQITLTDKFEKKLAITADTPLEEIVVYTLVVVEGEGERIRTNLKAPIIINAETGKAGQLVLTEEYPTRYYLFKEEKVSG
ncbi:flagellar assembly protein FliW [Fuchsiella alkaliacetigena]|uniref:flagellar assembly protein FliW n=1 Tax=Fuchsiella alkaliacetigena TaxID=957042 RepID=UPI00200B8AEB|nr:flagellar assembly protein FliW [Fuchsiella alkaliacetigena]MCK8824175.1 flagellar assembly protein FliW [Fuchsiella alkaliacetigena]